MWLDILCYPMEKVGYLLDAITHDSYKKLKNRHDLYIISKKIFSTFYWYKDIATFWIIDGLFTYHAVQFFVRNIWILEHWI